MTDKTEKRMVAFVRTIADRCTRCLRRREENCRLCISRWANEIMSDWERDIAAGSHSQYDYSLSARMMMIIDRLQEAKCPLLASEIDISKYCSKQLKQWTLKRMIRLGYIGRMCDLDDKPPYRYYLTKKPFPVSKRD